MFRHNNSKLESGSRRNAGHNKSCDVRSQRNIWVDDLALSSRVKSKDSPGCMKKINAHCFSSKMRKEALKMRKTHPEKMWLAFGLKWSLRLACKPQNCDRNWQFRHVQKFGQKQIALRREDIVTALSRKFWPKRPTHSLFQLHFFAC